MNRRDFVITGSAAAAMATQGMTARSYAGITGANDRMNLGIIGLGRRASVVTGGGFVKDPRVNFVALCDVYDKQTADFQHRFHDHLSSPATFVDYHDLLGHKDVDSVFVATPDHLHVQIAKDVLGAGKNIYIEKPTVHRWHERDALMKAAAEHKQQVLHCGMQQRSGDHYMRVKSEIFDTHQLGDVVLVRAVWHNFPWQRRVIENEPKPAGLNWELFLGPAPRVPYETSRYSSWRSYHDYGNGLLADILTHWVDVAQWMMGDDQPLRAVALGGDYNLTGDLTNPDTISAIIQYKGWNLNFESSVLSLRDVGPSVFFEGTKGTLNLTREGFTLKPNEGQPTQFDSKQNLEQAHTQNFVDAVLTGKPTNAPLTAGLAATLPVEMALASYWLHKTATPADLPGHMDI